TKSTKLVAIFLKKLTTTTRTAMLTILRMGFTQAGVTPKLLLILAALSGPVRTAFTHDPCWQPWNDNWLLSIRFVEIFCLSLEDFQCLLNKLQEELVQDPLVQGQPLLVEAQVAVGLYRLGQGSSHVTIGHVFNIGKEMVDKVLGRFVNVILKVFRKCVVRPTSGQQLWIHLGTTTAYQKLWGPLTAPTSQYLTRPMINERATSTGKVWPQSSSSVYLCGGGSGSMQNSRVFRRSQIGQSLQPGSGEGPMIPHGTFLIGDAGYLVNMKLLLPYPSVVNPANKWFNYMQSTTRIILTDGFTQVSLGQLFCVHDTPQPAELTRDALSSRMGLPVSVVTQLFTREFIKTPFELNLPTI
ncbi:hypothetical protein VP01_3742g2, partial [Puccinia sorghi]